MKAAAHKIIDTTPPCPPAKTEAALLAAAGPGWIAYHCPDCKLFVKISQRALTGKYMISDHHKVCASRKVTRKLSVSSRN